MPAARRFWTLLAGDIIVACNAPRVAEALRATTAPVGQITHIDVLAVPQTDVHGTIDARIEFLGARIAEITKGGQADRAGLAVGDEIVSIDGVPVTELVGRGLDRLIANRPGGTTVVLGILRGGTARMISSCDRSGRSLTDA